MMNAPVYQRDPARTGSRPDSRVDSRTGSHRETRA